MTPPSSPRFLTFILTGAVLGFALGGAIATFGWFENTDSIMQRQYAATAQVGYLGLLGAALFGLAAAILAVVIDQRRRR